MLKLLVFLFFVMGGEAFSMIEEHELLLRQSALMKLTFIRDGLRTDAAALQNLSQKIQNLPPIENESSHNLDNVLELVDNLQISVQKMFNGTKEACKQANQQTEQALETQMSSFDQSFEGLAAALGSLAPTTQSPPALPTPQARTTGPTNCKEAQLQGEQTGVTKIFLETGDVEEVYCDQDTEGGGWLVIMRRTEQEPEQLSFKEGWRSYVTGFGDLEREFWLGLEVMHKLTSAEPNELLVTMRTKSESAKSFYEFFEVGTSASGYRLSVQDYDTERSTAGDSLTYHNQNKFSTFNDDNDQASGGSCSEWSGSGGWWYNYCFMTNPTGVYGGHLSLDTESDMYLEWRNWQGYYAYLTDFQMMVRPS